MTAEARAMKVFGIAGWSGSGKTTLMVRLLPALVSRGYRVSTMKHAHHDFDVDQPGKDSYEHRRAGATEVLVTSTRRWALMHEARDEPEPDPTALIGRMTPVDLLLVEGFKTQPHDKLEVWRRANGDKPLLASSDPTIVALAGDGSLDPATAPNLPILDVDDIPAIAAFIIGHCRLAPRDRIAERA